MTHLEKDQNVRLTTEAGTLQAKVVRVEDANQILTTYGETPAAAIRAALAIGGIEEIALLQHESGFTLAARLANGQWADLQGKMIAVEAYHHHVS